MNFYRAVVEDNNDPEKIGRLKVRIFGLHTANNENSNEEFNYISTNDLPWAEVMGGTAFGLNGGIGTSSILNNGTWVWVFLHDNNPNKPVIFGTIIGAHTQDPTGVYDAGKGFCDPSGTFPFPTRSSESDLNRLARNSNLDQPYYETSPNLVGNTNTIHDAINSSLDGDDGNGAAVVVDDAAISDVDGGNTVKVDVSQIEPLSTNDVSEYPNVNVIETTSGHVLEFDDTPTNERIRLYHRTGSYIEIKPDGTFVQKSANTDSSSHYIHMSDVEKHIAGAVKNYIEGNIDEIIKGDVKRYVDLTLSEHIKGEVNRTLEHNLKESITGGIKEHISLDQFSKVDGFLKITAGEHVEIIGDVKITGNLEVTQDITSSGGGITSANDIRSGAGIEDSAGRLDALRGAYDAHFHIGNLGIPTATPTTTDPKSPANYADFTWTNSPKGFK